MNLFSGEDYVWRNSVGPEVPCPWLLHHQPHAAQQDYQGTRRWVVQSSQECIQRFWPKYVIIIYHHRWSILSSRNKITNVTGPNLEKYYSISCCWVVWWWPGASVGKISRGALAHVLRLNRELSPWFVIFSDCLQLWTILSANWNLKKRFCDGNMFSTKRGARFPCPQQRIQEFFRGGLASKTIWLEI